MKKVILCGHDISEYTVITAADPDNFTKKAASEFIKTPEDLAEFEAMRSLPKDEFTRQAYQKITKQMGIFSVLEYERDLSVSPFNATSQYFMSKMKMYKKTANIKDLLRKSGINTLQDVLNTNILSNDAKIKYIRHTYTCYEQYLKTFYRDDFGIKLRKELKTFLFDLV